MSRHAGRVTLHECAPPSALLADVDPPATAEAAAMNAVEERGAAAIIAGDVLTDHHPLGTRASIAAPSEGKHDPETNHTNTRQTKHV